MNARISKWFALSALLLGSLALSPRVQAQESISAYPTFSNVTNGTGYLGHEMAIYDAPLGGDTLTATGSIELASWSLVGTGVTNLYNNQSETYFNSSITAPSYGDASESSIDRPLSVRDWTIAHINAGAGTNLASVSNLTSAMVYLYVESHSGIVTNLSTSLHVIATYTSNPDY